MLPVEKGDAYTLKAIIQYSVVMVLVSLALVIDPAVGWLYLISAIALGGWFLTLTLRLRREPALALRVFVYSNLYLTLLFGAAALDSVIG